MSKEQKESKWSLRFNRRNAMGAFGVLIVFVITVTQFQNCAGSHSSFDISTAASSGYTVNLVPSNSTVNANVLESFAVTALSATAGQALNVTVGYYSGQTQQPYSQCVFSSVASGATETCTVPMTTAGELSLYVQVSDAGGNLLINCASAGTNGCGGVFAVTVASTTGSTTPTPTATPVAMTPTPTATPTITVTPANCIAPGASCASLVRITCAGNNTTQGSLSQCATCCTGNYYQGSCYTQTTCYEGAVMNCPYFCD